MKILIYILTLNLVFNSAHCTSIRMADKNYIIKKLQTIFLINNKTDEDFTNIIMNNFEKQRQFFGDSCDPYQALFLHEDKIPSGATTENFSPEKESKVCNSIDDLSTKSDYSASVGRVAITISTCLSLTDLKLPYMRNVHQKICGNSNCSFNSQSINKAYSLFYPFTQMSDTDSRFFKDLLANMTDKNAFKYLVLSLCMDPNWQAI